MTSNRIIICVALFFTFDVHGILAEDSTNRIVRRLPVRINLPLVLPPATNGNLSSVQPSPVTELPKNVITWDSEIKEAMVEAGALEARFAFSLTNVSSSEVTVTAVQTSCGCTIPHGLPKMPWTLLPGTNAQFDVSMNLAGKTGITTKSVTIFSDHGNKTLLVTTTIQTAPAAAMGDRQKNQQLALADPQAVFKGDCASCHVEPTKGKSGKDLYVAACGICHEAEHRASMVPDLHALTYPTNEEVWRNWIMHGKPGTLMPAFSIAEGGILTEDQIASLVSYLTESIGSPVGRKLPE